MTRTQHPKNFEVSCTACGTIGKYKSDTVATAIGTDHGNECVGDVATEQINGGGSSE